MNKVARYLTVLGAAAAMSATMGSIANSQMAPFGDDKSVAYAAKLWEAMGKLNLTGNDMIRSFPYEGTDPHGVMLETFYMNATVDGHTGALDGFQVRDS